MSVRTAVCGGGMSPLNGLGRSAAALAIVSLAGGCSSPIRESSEAALRASVENAIARELEEAEQYDGAVRTEREDRSDDLGITERSLREIRELYDAGGYFLEGGATGEGASDDWALSQVGELLGEDLYGRRQRAVALGLRRAVVSAAERNLLVQSARIEPAISESEVVEAEAVFDWTLFTNGQWIDEDTPTAGPGFLALPETVNAEQRVEGEVGVRRRLVTGGEVSFSQRLIYQDIRQSGFGAIPNPNPSYFSSLTATVDQPLLRGFGSDVALAEIRLARNQERRSIAELKAELLDTLTETELTYWELVSAHRELVIAAKLLERGLTVRDELRARLAFDAVQSQVADAVATVESRRGDVLRARTNLRRVSDRLKALMNDPDLPVGSETLLVPVDRALDEAVEFSLVDALAAALRERPEVDAAVLGMDDASIRQMVAENGMLPDLDLRAEMSLLGFDENGGDALGEQDDGEFIDNFLLGLFFERPIGNRGPRAAFRGARLERLRSAVDYRRVVQDVVLEVKAALDEVVLNYELIEQARTSRIAAAEALRTFLVDKELTERGFTAERLDLEFTQQESLAAAERAEIAALVDYNTALAELHRAMGTVLRRNRIDFVVPDANQVFEGERAIDYRVGIEPGEAPAGAEPAEGPSEANPPADVEPGPVE